MSFFASTPLAPPDPIFHLTASYKADKDPAKINLGVGAYRTNDEKPLVLPVVRKAEKIIVSDESLDHEYLPIDGLKSFTDASAALILGKDSPAIKEGRVSSLFIQLPKRISSNYKFFNSTSLLKLFRVLVLFVSVQNSCQDIIKLPFTFPIPPGVSSSSSSSNVSV